MTDQLERELRDLFHVEAARVEVWPARPVRRRVTRLNAGIAAATTLIVVAGATIAAARLQADDRRAVRSAGEVAAAGQLRDLLRRTLAHPVQIRSVVGAPGDQARTTAVVDLTSRQASIDREGQTQISVGGVDYSPISEAFRVTKLPREIAWSSRQVPAKLRSFWPLVESGLPWPLASLATYAGPGAGPANLVVTRLGSTHFHLVSTETGAVCDAYLAGDGSLVRADMTAPLTSIGGRPGAPTTEHQTAFVSKWTRPLNLRAPDPRTVITWDALMRLLGMKPAACHPVPSSHSAPGSTAVECGTETDSSGVAVTSPRPGP